MRALLLVCLLIAAGVAHAQQANTPDNGDQSAEGFCLIKTLSFTNGLVLTPGFSPNWFTYTCSCDFSSGSFSTVVKPVLMDDLSSAEIRFNGQTVHDKDTNNAISNDGTREDSPLKQSEPLEFQPGQNTIVIGVSCNGMGQPDPCYYEYTISCNMPTSGGGQVVGDPQFQGLRGQSYQVHGVAGEVYSIVSDSDLQYNARFVFLSEGRCPVVEGRRQRACWSHPGSYLGELGLKTKGGDRIHAVAGPADFGFQSLTVNERELLVGDTVWLADDIGAVTRNSTHLTTVQTNNWTFEFENSDMFVNQRVRVGDSRGLRSHGLLGQTWRDAVYPNAIKYVQGSVDDYVIRDNDIFGDNFVYNAFN